MLVEYIRHRVSRPIKRVTRLFKLLSVLDKLDISIRDNNVYIKMDSTLIINNDKDILLYSQNGKLITKHKRTHINPAIKINIVKADTDELDRRSITAGNTIKKHKLFTRLLQQGKIKQMD